VADISRRHKMQAEIKELIPALQSFAKKFCKSSIDADDLVRETMTRTLASGRTRNRVADSKANAASPWLMSTQQCRLGCSERATGSNW
jgi:DNA-directed RNA polymerase specialized sigma24 family protein